jgi:AhpD family alkylhydroperoxidase
MSTRIRLNATRDRDILGALLNLGATVRKSGLEHPLLELVKTRVSQINGCGHCLDMHTKDARAAGESEQRLYMLSAWWETSIYTDRERAALRWAEAVTRLENQRVAEDVYQLARQHFSEQELIALTLAVAEINAWNRFAIAFQYSAGNYQPGSLNR